MSHCLDHHTGGPPHTGAGFWRVLFLLLGTARRRARGRQKRQRELLQQRGKSKSAFSWEGLATFFTLVLMMGLHGVAAYVLHLTVKSGARVEAERDGRVIVSQWFATIAARPENPRSDESEREEDRQKLESSYSDEARTMKIFHGGTKEENERKLRAVVAHDGAAGLISRDDVPEGLGELSDSHTVPAMLGSIVLLWWAAMLICQGEGLELDLQRRRHPMWEWIFSHPVRSNAVFAAEMLSPIVANPVYWAAPIFAGVLYTLTYDLTVGLAATLLVGVPVMVALACMGKALEIACILRFSPRSRGALIGLMSWFGYASMMLLFVGITSVQAVATHLGRVFLPLTALPWPWLGMFLGRQADGSFSVASGVGLSWAASFLTGTVAVWFCVWGANRGLSGNTGGSAVSRPGKEPGRSRFGREPLYRKEFLWFIRDRSAIVQTILIPLTIASFQVFNLRHALNAAQGSWNYLCGAAIIFGTYFLWVLGPKSLASEGPALWLSLTWPRGLESLLKAKAWLWSLISTGIVSLVLAYAIYLFPGQAWKVVLVGVGWLVFGRSMAEKTVTLVAVTSSSGDPEPIPRSRQWAASLGMLTFGIGVLTQQWNIAVVGIVYSYITAAAMWENFRARLPYLYDPWSEKLPPPPTLMHAMVAISILVEGVAVLLGVVVALAGREHLGVAYVFAYAAGSLAVSIGVAVFLNARNVPLRAVWRWPGRAEVASGGGQRPWWCGDGGHGRAFALALFLGVAGGATLGALALGYRWCLLQFPATRETLQKMAEQLAASPDLKIAYAVCAVGIAPFAEEYLFRGLVFRALDREWGGWRAVLGSAAFFAIYHPPLSWLPVGLLGAANAVLFKKTGRLAAAVLLHIVYNAAAVLAG